MVDNTEDGFGDLARTTIRLVKDGQRTSGGSFERGSMAAMECSSESFADEWSAKPNQDAWFFVHLASTSGWDHLRALAALLKKQRVIGSLSTVARGAVEAFALAFYIGAPEVEPRERVRRYMNVRLQSLHDQGLLLAVMHGDRDYLPKADQEHLESALEAHVNECRRVVSSARRQGFAVKLEKDQSKPTFLDQRVPTKTALCQSAVAAGGPTNVGSVYYKSLSAVAHSTIHGFEQHVQVPDSWDEENPVRLVLSDADAAIRLVAGPLAAISVLTSVYPHCGWAIPQNAIDDIGFTWMGVGRVAVPEGAVIPPAFQRPGWGE